MTERIELPDEVAALLSAEGDGPALPIDEARARALVDRTLDEFAATSNVTPLRGRRTAAALLVACVLGGSAAAAMYLAPKGEPAPRTPPADAAPMPKPAVAAPTAEAMAQPEVATSAEQDLLRQANAMRGRGEYRDAERTYLRVVAQNPNGTAAYAARVAAAALRAERLSDPGRAVGLYKDALHRQPQGALTPEIHEGMAAAYRKLGKAHSERVSLEALILRQPDGPAAERARERVRELDAARRGR
jgi:tetratricopeptide (TPR) repeat protein